MAAVDLSALAVVRHIPLTASPTQLIGHSGRHVVYALTAENGTVHEISSTRLERRRWINICRSAIDMHSVDGESIWILAREPRELIELKLESFEIGRRIPLPGPVEHFDLSLEAPQALVSFGDTGKAAVVDLVTRKFVDTDCGSPIHKVRFRKDGRQWVAAHRNEKLLTIADTASGRLVVRLPLAMKPVNLCYKSDGGELFVTGEGSDAVAIVFPYSTEVAETVLAGRAPGPMAASSLTDSGAEYLFVTNPQSGQLTILNIVTRKVVAVPQVGAEPSHVVVTPDNTYALVLNRKSGDMAVILIQSATRRTKFPAALLTMIPVGSKPVDAVVQAV